ncbi:MAG: DUF4097 family beta strand repeat-containing protein, partial [Flavobacteriaceae bacterium]
MKGTLRFILCMCLVVLVPRHVFSQDGEKLTIPLSDPQSQGHLKVGVLSGSISVVGHSGSDVIVETENLKKHQNSSTRDGLRRVSGAGNGFSVEEYNNRVTIRSHNSNKRQNFKIRVPRNFSLKLNATNNGNIYVSGVHGEMEISNTNGAITLENISGSVVADALNKNIVVTFDEVTPNAPMAFTSLNGNLDVTFPTDVKATIKAKTENGNVYTDFEMEQRVVSNVD